MLIDRIITQILILRNPSCRRDITAFHNKVLPTQIILGQRTQAIAHTIPPVKIKIKVTPITKDIYSTNRHNSPQISRNIHKISLKITIVQIYMVSNIKLAFLQISCKIFTREKVIKNIILKRESEESMKIRVIRHYLRIK